MKLTPAKCPSCEANIEVDKDSDKTKCEYCHTQILVEEAIQKIKIEYSGTVKVDGIKSVNEKLEDVIKFIDIDSYDKASKILNELFEKNPFNIDVIKVYMDCIDKCLKKYNGIGLDGINGENYMSNIIFLDMNGFADFEKRFVDFHKIVNKSSDNKFNDEINSLYAKLETAQKDSKIVEEQIIIEQKEKQELRDAEYNRKQEVKQELVKKCNQYLFKKGNFNFKEYLKRLERLFEYLDIDINNCTNEIIKEHGFLKTNKDYDGIIYLINKIDYFGKDYVKFESSQNIGFYYKKDMDIDEALEKVNKLLEENNKSIFSKLFNK